jgi:hypothetical protein
MAEPRKSVFLSYAHEDRKWAEEVEKFLAPWIRDKRIKWWDDSKIQAGADWRVKIQEAIDEAAVAVLLVTPAFLNSNFIVTQELPEVLDRVRQNKIRLAWIAVRHSSYEATELARFQSVNDPSRPLEALAPVKRNEALVEIAKRIADAVTMRTLAGGLQLIDQTTEPFEAALDRRPAQLDRTFRVQAEYKPDQDRIAFIGATTVITVADLAVLPDDDREFIADLEDSLARNYHRWSLVRKGLGDAGGALDTEIEDQLTRIAKLICGDLNSILGFLKNMHKYELEDHYSRYRYICERLTAT